MLLSIERLFPSEPNDDCLRLKNQTAIVRFTWNRGQLSNRAHL